MSATVHPVLLCGGSGTRLWPLSRKAFPKQFTQIMGDESLFQATARRLSGPGFGAPVIVTSNDFRFIVTEQLAKMEREPRRILIEPVGRNTAAAVLAAALTLGREDQDALILVAPSDHIILDTAAFRAAVAAATPRALGGDLVTFGIPPTRPETGYGYLELAAGADPHSPAPLALVSFVEKPGQERAEQMIASDRYLWNAGVFLFTARHLIAAFETHAPDVLTPVVEAVEKAAPDLSFLRLDPVAWKDVPDISFDYAIMEKATNRAVMPLSAGWSDIGSWDAIWQESGPDDAGNVTSDRATALDCTGTLLRSEDERIQLVGIGLTDIVAIATSDAVLVARRSDVQQVKEAVARLAAKKVRQATEFPHDHRPWGRFDSLARGPRFQVKRIVVKPGAALSLQSHYHRSEHWIVVQGTAKVTVNDEVKLVSENESIYIPLGAAHRLENPGKLPIVLIEVQTGSYLGEDDIIRYEDLYDRGQVTEESAG